jgi:hypothetical protein
LEEVDAITADLLAVRQPLGSPLRKLKVGDAGAIALIPLAWDPSREPLRRRNGERIERMPHRLADTFQPIEHPDGGENMRGVGPLSSTRSIASHALGRR